MQILTTLNLYWLTRQSELTKMSPLDITILFPFIVVTVSLTLYFSVLLRLRPSKETRLTSYIRKASEKQSYQMDLQDSKRGSEEKEFLHARDSSPQREMEEKECPHYVGYLTTLRKGSSFPDECFGCRRVIQCIRIETTKVIESFYMEPTDAP